MIIKIKNIPSDHKISAHFKLREFSCKCARGGLHVTEIDWELVEWLEEIRKHFGKPVIINSAFRCEDHNSKVGGKPNSQHLTGNAADIKINGVSPEKIAAYAKSLTRNAGHGGVGTYNTFVHIDTRRNKIAEWRG